MPRRTEPLEFLWIVPSSGFHWLQARPNLRLPGVEQSPEQRVLVAKGGESQPAWCRTYKPLESYTGLFRTFAETKISESDILQFANKYGCLGGECRSEARLGASVALSSQCSYGTYEVDMQRGLPGSNVPTTLVFRGVGEVSPGAGPRHFIECEIFETWARAISTMREMVSLWEFAKNGDLGELNKLIVWKDKNAVYYKRSESLHPILIENRIVCISSRSQNPELLENMKAGDLITPAWYYLQQRLNQKLKRHVAIPRLLWNRRQQLRFVITPTSLISAMWLQLSIAVDGNRNYRICEDCRRWFEVGAEARSDAKFCSNACRQKTYRKRKSMHQELSIGK